MGVISRQTEERDGFTIVVDRVHDRDADLSYLLQDYSEIADVQQRIQQTQADAARLAAYHAGDWVMTGVCVTVRKQTASRWADGGLEVGRASLWAVESDSSESYYAEIERDLIAEAFAEVGRLREALAS